MTSAVVQTLNAHICTNRKHEQQCFIVCLHTVKTPKYETNQSAVYCICSVFDHQHKHHIMMTTQIAILLCIMSVCLISCGDSAWAIDFSAEKNAEHWAWKEQDCCPACMRTKARTLPGFKTSFSFSDSTTYCTVVWYEWVCIKWPISEWENDISGDHLIKSWHTSSSACDGSEIWHFENLTAVSRHLYQIQLKTWEVSSKECVLQYANI